MLRLLVALLLAANLGFWAWSAGKLDALTGARADGDREPERLARQVRPESIRLVPAEAASAAVATAASAAASAGRAASVPVAASAASAARVAASAAAPAASGAAALACLEAGPFGTPELPAVQSALAAVVPPGRWTDRRSETPGLWYVYMGPYPDPELLQKKKDEVAGIRVAFEEVSGVASLEPGLSLGRFESRAAADAALARSVVQGIRTARVVQVRPPVVNHHLRVQSADAATAARLSSLKLGAAQRVFRSC